MKNGRPRVVPALEEIRPWLDALPFDTTDNRVRTAIEPAREAIGPHDVRFHDLRHTYASFLAVSNTPMTAVRDLLRHSSLLGTSR